jgi:hypothetical protein
MWSARRADWVFSCASELEAKLEAKEKLLAIESQSKRDELASDAKEN